MGEIYRATDTVLGRAVAVKVLDERYAADDAVRERFTREALAVARLTGNAHIVTIYDVGEWGERPFIVMEYLGGGSLADRLNAHGAQPPGQALEWLEQAASALDAAHREGVVHRDVKPANLLFDRHGRLHVADFGIASAAGLGSVTQTGTVLGTVAYLSPEQARGERVTGASDRFALAVVAFELLTGHRPVDGDASALAPALPRTVDAVFRKALAVDPGERYETCVGLVGALRGAFEDEAGTTRVLPVLPPRRRPRRARIAVLLGLLALVAIAAGLAGLLLRGQRGAPTAQPPPPTHVRHTATRPSPSPPPTPDPHTLNDRAWSLIEQGDFAAALPLLESAVLRLRPGDVFDAYANYNLGYALLHLGRCADALPYLETAKGLEPSRHEVHDALKQALRCGGGQGDEGDQG